MIFYFCEDLLKYTLQHIFNFHKTALEVDILNAGFFVC